ncbi:nephrin-like isoform X2 [Haliotis asinina]|uniref:nephrin-like isoform X2 n=1 Tax=Haliotis asinina TaxID=109174 RepID=UPI0035325655
MSAMFLSTKISSDSLWIILPFIIFEVYAVQRFSEVPKNTSVIQGQSALLRCVVRDKQGSIQWTKDGFALGFDRSIPGFSRYSVVGSSQEEFNLNIVNTQLDDDAEYRCQVLPAQNNPPIQAFAHLTVLVPPSMPEIEGYSNGSVVEVPQTQSLLSLTCKAANGRPPATISWYRNGVKVTNNVEYSTQSSTGDKRSTAISIIHIRLTQRRDENNAIYTCQATNTAISGSPLTTVVQISILEPPGAPEISGYTDNQVVRTNDTLQLTCTSRGGNPLGTVVWYRNDEQVDYSYVSVDGKAENEYTFTVNSFDNNAIYRCEVSNLVTQRPYTAQYKLTVHFSPNRVAISGGDRPAKAGQTVKLDCVSSNSNPAAVITWFARGRQLAQTDTRVEDSPDGGYISKSTLSVQLSHQDHNVKYTCQATNPALGQSVDDTVTLSVLYPPNKPIISGYTEGNAIKAGELARITCQSSGGNPVAKLKWYKGSRKISSENTKRGNLAQAVIKVVATPSDNGATYKCTAQNEATTSPLKTYVNLTVLFPPASVSIKTWPAKPKAGQLMNITCVSASSNPAADITWIKGADRRRVQGIDRGEVEAENDGKSTTNVLEFLPTSADHNAYFGCQATNRIFGQAVTDALTLNVLFAPEFNSTGVPEKVDLIEGNSVSLNFSTYSNPAEVTYKLYRGNVQLSLPSDIPRFQLTKGILKITKIRRGDRGDFTIKASNAEGFTTHNFSIEVRYPATIKKISGKVMEDEGGVAFFECIGDANPITPNMVTWSRANYDMSKTRQTYEKGKAHLTVHELSRTDTGDFVCTADNKIGKAATKKAKLIVKYAPVIDKSPEYSKAASEEKSTGKLFCKASGAPTITFTWFKNGQTIDTSKSKYSVSTSKSGDVDYTNTLQVKAVAKGDYGRYMCKATNAKGTDSIDIVLDGTSKPDPPYDIQFVNATHNTITISWKPGFDGGLIQNFQVRYRLKGERGFVYIDITVPGTTTFIIKGLKLGSEYEITVMAFNSKGKSEFQENFIRAKTSNVAPPEDITSTLPTDEVPVIIILVVCIVGIFLLTLNVGLILFFVRRRRKRLENGSDTTSHTNTFELYGHTKGDGGVYPMSASEDGRSYGTYDKSMDDFSDDYSKDYENDDCKRVFLPQSDYGSRPYTPNKLDSPRMGHKQTYILDDQGRQSPWTEDPYRVALPRKKGTFENSPDKSGRSSRQDTRPKSITDYCDRPPSRPPSRTGKTPPPPPVRTSSRGAADQLPPLPARNYGPQDLPPRYTSPPGNVDVLSPNIVANLNYDGPPMRSPSPRTMQNGNEMRGHLV